MIHNHHTKLLPTSLQEFFKFKFHLLVTFESMMLKS